MHVDKSLALVRRSEELLGGAFLLLADRHGRDRDVADVATVLAGWSRRSVEQLGPFVEHYGRAAAQQPEQVRSALFGGPRLGKMGVLRDVQDTLLLARQSQSAWRALQQGVQTLGDTELLRLCEQASERTDRQVAWLEEQARLRAPAALTREEGMGARLRSAVPRRSSAQALPEVVWAPLAAALMLAAVALAAALLRAPLLLPSLGPSAYLLATQAPHPSSRPFNVVAGHLLALLAGFLAVAISGASGAPPLGGAAEALATPRLVAAVLALPLALLATATVRAWHPPAGATALLVALGWVRTLEHALLLMGGVAVLALLGTLLRWARMGRSRSAQEARGEQQRGTAHPV
jgi:hypothetical protein